MKDTLVLILMAIGVILLIFANIVGIGNFLYDWGKLDLPIGASAWNAFVIWLKMLGGGAVSLIVAKIME